MADGTNFVVGFGPSVEVTVRLEMSAPPSTYDGHERADETRVDGRRGSDRLAHELPARRLPPLGMAASGGVGGRETGHAEGVGSFEATVRPLAAIGSLRDRPIDAGAGFALEVAGDYLRYGPSLDVRAFPLNRMLGTTWRARLGVGVEGRVSWDDTSHQVGPSGALSMTGELVPWVDGDCSAATSNRSVFFGCYYGEGAIGFRLQGSYGVVADSPTWTITLGLEFRVPLVLGILLLIPK